ncbi:OsmC family protein [Poseidonocella sedimentorum]|uniref:Organic hydroperoxide reductase OsmC/OhrA n=1 Tax=Poseidonocella sedimentorum TaxID=871652 RepID=A0A1I6CQ41_9RHOB|nr:OsmC family protein [Poseidonocella sedimentorum]SFQ95316.1 Organic hydroperoxide reductase OsmC/OhrA [Poseidonocella sedimentorum]
MSRFAPQIRWTGNRGEGTARYHGYDRSWEVATPGKPVIACSNDPMLGGDPGLHNPEDMLLAALSACHMLWYLHLAAEAGVVVLRYEDAPEAEFESDASGAGRFTAVTLRPRIGVAPGSDLALADTLHARIGAVCFIARSVAFPVHHAARYVVVDG